MVKLRHFQILNARTKGEVETVKFILSTVITGHNFETKEMFVLCQ